MCNEELALPLFRVGEMRLRGPPALLLGGSLLHAHRWQHKE